MPPFTTCVAELVYHTKLHTSQTDCSKYLFYHGLVYHKKLHTSQIAKLEMRCCLTTIKNYIPIKRSAKFWLIIISFKPIKNYILLKLLFLRLVQRKCLFTIQNYTPLKRTIQIIFNYICLTTIKNYTPLKPKYNM